MYQQPVGTPLWALTIDDLEIGVRPYNVFVQHGLTKAWHVAVLCDTCLCRLRNFGRHSLAVTRETLRRYGFPDAPARCAHQRRSRWNRERKRDDLQSSCADALQECRAMLGGET